MARAGDTGRPPPTRVPPPRQATPPGLRADAPLGVCVGCYARQWTQTNHETHTIDLAKLNPARAVHAGDGLCLTCLDERLAATYMHTEAGRSYVRANPR